MVSIIDRDMSDVQIISKTTLTVLGSTATYHWKGESRTGATIATFYKLSVLESLGMAFIDRVLWLIHPAKMKIVPTTTL